MREHSLFQDLDWTSVLIYFLLVGIGILSIISNNYNPELTDFFDTSQIYTKQIIFFGISLIIALFILILDAKFYTTFAYFIYSIILLLLVLVLFIGKEIKGNQGWFVIGGFQFQPAELGKMASALALSKYMVDANVDMDLWKHRIISMVIIFLPAFLVLLQGDAGSTMVYIALMLPLYREGLPGAWFVAGFIFIIISLLALVFNKFIIIGILIIIAFYIIYKNLLRQNVIYATIFFTILLSGYVLGVNLVFNKLKPHQQDRINVILGKKVDMRGVGYNLNQSKIAIGSGGLFGKGFRNGSQTKFNFVPEQHTDYIFCTIGEEYGFIGVVFLFSLIIGLMWRLLNIAERQRSDFSRIYIYGIIGILCFHNFVNLAMTIGLFPTIGIPLPFISYGGSSLIAFTIMLFIALRLDTARYKIFK
jgi:rod shape determining protein RodA